MSSATTERSVVDVLRAAKERPSSGPCIVCGEATPNRVRVEGRPGIGRPYWHWRCPLTEIDQCADRRDMNRKRPKGRDAAFTRALAAVAETGPADLAEAGQ